MRRERTCRRPPLSAGAGGASIALPLMSSSPLLVLAAASAGGLLACEPAAAPVSVRPGPVVYGEDERMEYFEVDDAELNALTAGTAVALLPIAAVRVDEDGAVAIDAPGAHRPGCAPGNASRASPRRRCAAASSWATTWC